MSDIVERLREMAAAIKARAWSLDLPLRNEECIELARAALAATPADDAVKRWREAHPGNDLVVPDRANIVVWLLEQHDAHAQSALDAETIQTLLDLLNPIHGEMDRQLPAQFTDEREWDAPDDREYNINITARMERDLTQAVLLLENRRAALTSTECAPPKAWTEAKAEIDAGWPDDTATAG